MPGTCPSRDAVSRPEIRLNPLDRSDIVGSAFAVIVVMVIIFPWIEAGAEGRHIQGYTKSQRRSVDFYSSSNPMSQHSSPSERDDREMPIRPDSDQLDDLEPHQETIERVAAAYFEGCRQVARGIHALKKWWRERDSS